MADDPNQIAKQWERREREMSRLQVEQPHRHNTPQRGEFTILSSFSDESYVIDRSSNVTVEVAPTGLVVLTHKDGSKTMFKPVEGWCMTFDPDHEGE